LQVLEAQRLAAPDQQISLTDPDSRSMATSGRGSGVVGYNVQAAVDKLQVFISRSAAIRPKGRIQ
jgi:transposase